MNEFGIPGVDTVLEQPPIQALLADVPRDVLVACIRECVDAVRHARQAEGTGVATPADTAALVAQTVADRFAASARPSLRRVINATGVIIHTNLGRAPLPPAIADAIAEIGRSYCNLELDLADGERSKRDLHVSGLLARLAGAEDATLVNNNAGALVLALAALAAGQHVVCSRGELVEIGGSFRLPDVIACSGATMTDVGTTNHTRIADYETALTDDTAAILKTHPSNFRLVGFTSHVDVAPLAQLARRAGIPLIYDAGSGLLLPAQGDPFTHEPVIRQAIADGADIVTFSTDKLLGGPQGGAIVGRRALIERINRHPLKRAFRVGKLTLAGVEATLHAHLHTHAPDTITMALIRRPIDQLKKHAQRLATRIRRAAPDWTVTVESDEASVGGGSLPGETIPTHVIWIEAPQMPADALGAAFRANEPPIMGRYRRGHFGLDSRTLLPPDTDDILAAVHKLTQAP